MKTRGFTLIEMLVVVGILAALAAIVVPLIDGMYTSNAGKATAATLVEIRNVIFGKSPQTGYVNDVGNWRGNKTYTLASGQVVTPYALPLRLHDLLANDQLPTGLQTSDINSRFRWRGPYLRSSGATYGASYDPSKGFTADYAYDTANDLAISDEWNKAIVLQYIDYSGFIMPADAPEARLVSAGPNGVLDTLPNDFTTFKDSNNIVRYGAPAHSGDDIILNIKRATN